LSALQLLGSLPDGKPQIDLTASLDFVAKSKGNRNRESSESGEERVWKPDIRCVRSCVKGVWQSVRGTGRGDNDTEPPGKPP
jgi:hypothetical protein